MLKRADELAQLFVENHGEGDRLRAQVRPRGAEGIGGLQRMPPLHAPTTRATRTDVNPKLPDDHARDREFFLILCGDARLAHPAATVRTDARPGRLVAFIDPSRPSAMRLHPVPCARLAAGPARIPGQEFREGRRLTMRRAPGLVSLALHPLEFTTQPLVLVLQSFALAAFVIALSFGALGTFAQAAARVGGLRIVVTRRLLRHATFMADS